METKFMKGLTLIELLITIAVVAILASIAIPSFRHMMLENRLATFSNDFIASVTQARGEAIKNRNQVIIRPINNNWNNGWQIVVDTNANGDFSDDSDEEVRSHTLSEQLELKGTPDNLIINANGAVNGFSWSGITVCDKRSKGREVNINGAGITSINKSPSC